MATVESSSTPFTSSRSVQKQLYNMLISETSFAYYPSDIRNSAEIKNINYNKDQSSVFFRPDYIIYLQNVPCVIVASCEEHESLESLLSMARLYAFEINNQFDHTLNPCQKIIVSDGNRVMATTWMQPRPMFHLGIDDIANVNYDETKRFVSTFNRSANIEQISHFYINNSSNLQNFKPSKLLSRDFLIGNKVFENNFGRHIIDSYQHVFQAERTQDRINLAKHAYVTSSEIKSRSSMFANSVLEYISLLDQQKQDNVENINFHKLNSQSFTTIIRGSKGSGKSSFIDFLRHAYLPTDINDNLCWCHIDVSHFTNEQQNITDRIFNEACNQIIESNECIELNDLDSIKAIFPNESQSFDSSIIESPDEDPIRKEIAYFNRLVDNKVLLFKQLVNFLTKDQVKLPIIVIDNIDEHISDYCSELTQCLDIIQNQNCLSMIAIRDSNIHRLDDLMPNTNTEECFFIDTETPAFTDVLQARLAYCMQGPEKNSSSPDELNTSGLMLNGNHVMLFLNCIYNSCFNNSRYANLLFHIIDNDIEKGLQIFIDSCVSGHITDKQLSRIFSFGSSFLLPNYTVLKIIAKPSCRYYKDEGSHVKNLFHCYELPGMLDPFIRLGMLHFLKQQQENHHDGVAISKIHQQMLSQGHNQENIDQQVSELERWNCISVTSSGHSTDKMIQLENLGLIHLDLLKDLTYISMVSEDTLFEKSQIANMIAKNIMGTGDYLKDSPDAELNNCYLLIQYLIENHHSYYSNEQTISLLLESMMIFIKSKIDSSPTYNCSEDETRDYPHGKEIIADITSVQNYGIFVGFDDNKQGLIHKSNIVSGIFNARDFEVGQTVKAKVISFSKKHRRFSLQLIERKTNAIDAKEIQPFH